MRKKIEFCFTSRLQIAPNTFEERTNAEHPLLSFYVPIELADHCRRQALLFGFD